MRDAATEVVRALQQAGHTAYWAGGCVRDMLLGREPKDFDIATSARPEDVSRLFRNTRHVGAQFGVVLVRTFGHSLEVATFRTDHDYEDGRRPTGVTFSTPQEDACRRDFTINGMFYDPLADEIHDFVRGRPDLEAGVIRAIGVPSERFAEDHLRTLRAIRFASRFGFEIDPTTWEAMRASAQDLSRISPERIRMELEAMLSRPRRADAARMLADCGAIDYLWTGSWALHAIIDRVTSALAALPDDARFEPSLAIMLAGYQPRLAAAACRDLKCSNETTDRVTWIVTHQKDFDDPDAVTLADLKLLMANDGFDELVDVVAALHRADNPDACVVDAIRQRAAAISPEAVAPTPFVNGDDLEHMQLAKGPVYKRILTQVYYEQLNETLVSRDAALARARALADESSNSR